jgi:ferritin-like metal-binding protein YciE
VAGEVEDKRCSTPPSIAAAQAVEHYEITRYGTLTAWAKQLGREDCAALLQQNLDEEHAADEQADQAGRIRHQPPGRLTRRRPFNQYRNPGLVPGFFVR